MSYVFPNETFSVSQNTEYPGPVRHYISNVEMIPKYCVNLNFTLTASNDVGSSDTGFVTGGFPIGNANILSHVINVYN